MTTKQWGGARKGSGPVQRHIELDMETATILRTITRHHQQVDPETSPDLIVATLIRQAWEDLDAASQQASERMTG